MTGTRCISEGDATALARGALAIVDAARVRAHTEECASCRAVVGALATMPPVQGSAPVPAQAPAATGELIAGRYVVGDVIGAGAMGVVYRARDTTLDRSVALKRVRRPNVAGIHDRLVDEARAMARLSHPAVVAVFDAGIEEGAAYIVMELVGGETLRHWLTARRSWRAIVELFVQAARGLAAAHAAGIVHGDFKPDNVLVGDHARARVTDFGLARLGDVTAEGTASSELTRTDVLRGTPAYMAPEQLGGEVVDARADQFAFCVALFEALFGVRPFPGDTAAELRTAIVGGAVRKVRAPVPAWLRGVVLRGLSPAPAARHPSMEALIAALGHDRTRRRAVVFAGLAAIGVTIGVVGWTRTRAVELVCEGSAAKLDRTWNASSKAAIHAAFSASGRPYAADAWQRVESAIDGYTRDWIAMHQDTCRATAVRREQPPDVLDLRMQCLGERRIELETTVALFAKADAALVARAAKLATSLSPIASCADVTALRAARPTGAPADPNTRAEVSALGDVLAAIRVLANADRFTEARPQLERAVERASAIGHAPARAEARLLAGSVARRDGDLVAADRHLREAMLAAEAGRADHVKAAALTGLVTLHTTWNHLVEAHDFASQAAATTARIGGTGRTGARLERTTADLLAREGKRTEALARYQIALAGYRRDAGERDDFDIAATLQDIGAVGLDLDHNAEAEAHYRNAHEMMVRLVGGGHPHVAGILAELSEALGRQNKADEARRVLESGLAIAERAQAPAESVAQFLNALGSLALEGDRAREALAAVDRAYQVLANANPKHTVLLNTVRLQGESLLALGRHDDALAKFEQAKGLVIAKKGPDNVDIAFADEAIAAVFEAQGKHARAVTALERAIARRERASPDDPDLPRTRFALARVLPAGHRKRAHVLAEQARAGFVSAGDVASAGEATDWLKTH